MIGCARWTSPPGRCPTEEGSCVTIAWRRAAAGRTAATRRPTQRRALRSWASAARGRRQWRAARRSCCTMGRRQGRGATAACSGSTFSACPTSPTARCRLARARRASRRRISACRLPTHATAACRACRTTTSAPRACLGAPCRRPRGCVRWTTLWARSRTDLEPGATAARWSALPVRAAPQWLGYCCIFGCAPAECHRSRNIAAADAAGADGCLAGPNSCSNVDPCDLDLTSCATGVAGDMRQVVSSSATYGYFCHGDLAAGALTNGAGKLCYDTATHWCAPMLLSGPAFAASCSKLCCDTATLPRSCRRPACIPCWESGI